MNAATQYFSADSETVASHSVVNGNGLPDANQLVLQQAPLVKRIALHLASRLPACVELDDLIQAGMMGLLEAASNFDTKGGASFETFAGFRIRGAMIDELRRGDWAPRSVHRRMRDAAEIMRNLEQSEGRPARESEVAAQLEMDMPTFRGLLSDASRCQALPLELNDDDGPYMRLDMPASPDRPEREYDQVEFESALVAAIKELPERDQLVLSLYYEQELNLKEIGEVLGVSESRVCQLQGRAHLRLRGKLQGWKDWCAQAA